MKTKGWMRSGLQTLAAAVLLFGVTAPAAVGADDDVAALKQRMVQMMQEIEAVQKKIEALEAKTQDKAEEMAQMDDRLNKAELHAAIDKVALGVELRSRADTLHYTDLRVAPGAMAGNFFVDYPAGFNNATLPQIQQAIGSMAAAGMIPPPETYDANNDIILTNKFRLNMHTKVNDQLSFAGRLAAYKVFGDSTEVKFNQGSLGDVTLDGNTTSLPHGDTIRLERAYFLYKKDLGPVPTSFSLGRRPSTEGPPLEFLNNSLEGGSPLATIINWQFSTAPRTTWAWRRSPGFRGRPSSSATESASRETGATPTPWATPSPMWMTYICSASSPPCSTTTRPARYSTMPMPGTSPTGSPA